MNKVEKLKKLIDEIDVLISKHVTISNLNFRSWYDKLEIFLIKNFQENNIYLQKIKKIRFAPLQTNIIYPPTQCQFIFACCNALKQVKEILNICMEELLEQEKQEKNTASSPTTETLYSYSRVFIVHGHNGELKQSVARLIEKQGIEAIILDEQANQGRTIIEKFEENSDVGGAICLFTADDLGKKKCDGGQGQFRARQNVVFETGYFMGKLGRDHVVIIAEPEMELPSDLLGIVYSNDKDWKFAVLNELDEMGYSIDMNKLKNKNR